SSRLYSSTCGSLPVPNVSQHHDRVTEPSNQHIMRPVPYRVDPADFRPGVLVVEQPAGAVPDQQGVRTVAVYFLEHARREAVALRQAQWDGNAGEGPVVDRSPAVRQLQIH